VSARTPSEATDQMNAELLMLEPPKLGAERVSELREVADLLEAHLALRVSMPDMPHNYTLLDGGTIRSVLPLHRLDRRHGGRDLPGLAPTSRSPSGPPLLDNRLRCGQRRS
jgi:hypothetical protein